MEVDYDTDDEGRPPWANEHLKWRKRFLEEERSQDDAFSRLSFEDKISKLVRTLHELRNNLRSASDWFTGRHLGLLEDSIGLIRSFSANETGQPKYGQARLRENLLELLGAIGVLGDEVGVEKFSAAFTLSEVLKYSAECGLSVDGVVVTGKPAKYSQR